MNITVVTSDTVYQAIHKYVTEKSIKITTYDEMIETILNMIKDGFCFPFDRDILRDAMECLTYAYCPGDEINRDRIIVQLEDTPDNDSDEDSDDESFNNMENDQNPMKLMSQLFSNMVDPNAVKASANKTDKDKKNEDTTTNDEVVDEVVSETPKDVINNDEPVKEE